MTDEPKARWRAVTSHQMDAATKDAAERIRNQLALAQEALKALLLANGGAMIALFTFVGNVLAKAPAVRFDIGNLRWAFGLFVAGFTLDLIAYVMAFLSQDHFFGQAMHELERLTRAALRDDPDLDQAAEFRANRIGNRYYLAGLALVIASVLLFGLGCGFALGGVLI